MDSEAVGSVLVDTYLRRVQGPSVECVTSASTPLLGQNVNLT